MPAAVIAAPVLAIGMTGLSAATAGLTAMTTIMAAVGAVGSVLGAVGALTGVKELQVAGTVLGVVGAVGGLASSAGIFGTTAAGLAPVAEVGGAAAGAAAGEVASNVTNLAADGINATVGQAGGYLQEALHSGLEGGLAGLGGEAGSAAASNVDIVSLVNDLGTENFNALDPAAQIADAQMVTPAAEALPETAVASAPAEAALPDLAQAEPPGLIDSVGLPDAATNAAVDPAQIGADGAVRDPYGRLLEMGGGDPGGGQLGAGVGNPSASSVNAATGQPDPGTMATHPQAVPEVKNSGMVDVTGPKITGSVSSEANISGFPAGAGPQGPSGGATAPTNAVTGNNGIWGRILGFVEDNKTLSLGALMAASSFISGAFKEGTTAEQRQAYATQAEQNLAAANLARSQNELLQRRLRNMNDAIPVARPISPPPGLINSVGAVTGQPA